jgi:hydroxymethylpyrimidine/phosphomethylpyrimidine kinase
VGAIGIQADLASFAAMGCHGLSVVTAILIGDTARVEDAQTVDGDWVDDQARVVLEDMPVAAFKIGVPGNIESISAIAEIMSDYPDVPLVLDPFLSAMPSQGEEDEDVLAAVRDLLIPQTTLLLISSVELGRLAETWREPATADSTAADAMRLIEMGCEYVLVTGTSDDMQNATNTLYDTSGLLRQDSWQRLPGSFSGAGNTLSATIAAMLANGAEVPAAVFEAQEFTNATLANAQRIGMGKLMPDRYFWARSEESDDGESPTQ